MGTRRTKPRLVLATAEQTQPERIEGMRVGVVVGLGQAGTVQVDFPGNPLGPLPARTTLALEAKEWQRAAREQQQATLFFDAGDPTRPVLMGLLQPVPVLEPAATPAEELLEARVDGRRVRLRARDEAELRCERARIRLTRDEVLVECGEASLQLRYDGQVVLRGVDVVNQAEGVQRIRGGKVKIN